MNSLGKFWALSDDKRKMLLGSAWRISWARLQIRIVPFQRIAESLEMPANGRHAVLAGASRDHASAVKWSTAILAARLPWCRNCLAQAVAAKRYLNRCGAASTLYLGVTTEAAAADLEAHAWLESDGQILTGESDDEYQVIYSQS
jgi:hypothetical protein